MAEQLRIREPGKHILRNPVTALWERPGLDDRFDEDHPLVRSHRWAFGTDAEIAAVSRAAREVSSVSIADVAPVEAAVEVPAAGRRGRRPSA